MLSAALALSLSLVACQRQEPRRTDSLTLTASAGAVELPTSADPDVRSATGALARGEPWRATRALEPVLADPSRRSPVAVLVAAEAAAGWEGWSRVQELLAAQPWIDTLAGGRGRALLARAALERSANAEAASHAARAVVDARARRERGAAMVALARALDRLEQRDSARVAYTEAATLLPEIGDWLRLRAAGVTADSAARATLYASIRTDVARARVRISEAQARERLRDFEGAARLFAALGEPADALRARLSGASDSASRSVVRRDIVTLVRARPGSGDARDVTALLDLAFTPLRPDEELAVARSAAEGGQNARAITGFSRAFAAKLGTITDVYAYATALSAAGRDKEAVAQFARVTAPASLAAQASYRRARAQLRAGDGAGARATLRATAARFPGDTSAAASSLLLLGDLLEDDGDDAAARASYRTIAARYPTSRTAPLARLRAAIIALAAGSTRPAALELDTLARRYASSDERNAADYWAGRAWDQLGARDSAISRWRGVSARDPLSYYAMLAARRLGEEPWAPENGTALPEDAAVDGAMARATLLERLGMDVEARLELDRLEADAGDASRLLATARALMDDAQSSRAIRLGWRALDGGAPKTAAVYRLVYPVVHESTLVAAAKAKGLEPALVAALVRQESSFNPRATSPVGARGLMQLMPSVGRQIAQGAGYPVWDPVLLYQPDVSLDLGTRHLAGLLRGGRPLERSLAAYNAGEARLARWVKRAGADDPELFVERIPYDETRDYVRIVLRNRELYRALYGLGE